MYFSHLSEEGLHIKCSISQSQNNNNLHLNVEENNPMFLFEMC